MKKKKERKKKATTTKTTRQFAENVQSQQVLDLRDRNLATKGELRPSPKQAELAVKWSNILQCLCNCYYRGEKNEKGKLVKCTTADTTTKKRVLGFTVHVQERCPDPRSRSMICD